MCARLLFNFPLHQNKKKNQRECYNYRASQTDAAYHIKKRISSTIIKPFDDDDYQAREF